jgi:superfamily II DNA or RNA helicase
MANSIDYFRGVGFFSSGWLREASEGLVSLAECGGRGRIVTSPILSDADWEAFRQGDEAQFDESLRQTLRQRIEDLATSLQRDTLNCLAWLVADGLLEFRFAVPRPGWKRGDYHDKVWVFTDGNGDRVALHGSFNDSVQGTLNGEAISVFRSWEPAQVSYVDAHAERLRTLWVDRSPQFSVRTIPEAAREALIRLRDPGGRPYEQSEPETPVHTAVNATRRSIEMRPYQREAIAAWEAAGYRGIFEMATGTGKTYTALSAAAARRDQLQGLAVVLLVPYLHMLDQWSEHCETFGFKPLVCSGEDPRWRTRLASAVRDFRIGLRKDLCVVAVHQTASGPDFSSAIEPLPAERLLVIGDEVHGLGASSMQRAMQPNAAMHLGLSATPRRWLDEAGTHAIEDVFGEVCFSFGLEEAIRDGFLVPYDYEPVLVRLAEDEYDSYRELTAQVVRISAAAKRDQNTREIMKRLLIKRAAVVWGAREKLPTLLDLLQRERREGDGLKHTLVYCAPGEHSRVLRALADLGLRCHEFVHTVSVQQRRELLNRFEQGEIEVLVAVRCLDEGVDVPATKRAFFLSSTTNPRQFVQRRGRVLRPCQGKTHAEVFDFLVVPSDLARLSERDSALSLLRREMPRFAEFSLAARNTHSAREKLFPLLDSFGALNMLDETPWEIYDRARTEPGAFLSDDPMFGGASE